MGELKAQQNDTTMQDALTSGVKDDIGRDIEFRNVALGDETIVHDIYNRAYREVVERQFGPWNQEEQDVFFMDSWDKPNVQIVTYNGTICGYFVLESVPDGIFIYELVISPEFQSKGIGTYLLRITQHNAGAIRKAIMLEVLHNNLAAKKLYESLGFTETGSNETHYQMRWEPKHTL